MVKSKWLDSAFDGIGAKRTGGRWNSKGRLCTYVSSSVSLALLEVMVHLKSYDLLANYVLMELEFPADSAMSLPDEDLPLNWREYPAPPETADVGDMWLADGVSLALSVPSVIVPMERNYLLNPAHDGFAAAVATARVVDFSPDPRL